VRVFLSWSGERSKSLALALKTWLPDVVQRLDPWISAKDIDRGTRWGVELLRELEKTDIGIVCLTPENVTAPWILFESGALSKAIDRSRVCTYLFHLRPSDLQGPLADFQATQATESETLELVQTLNRMLGDDARSQADVKRGFEMWWPVFQKELESIPTSPAVVAPLRSDRDLLEEIIKRVRQQERHSSYVTGRVEQTQALSSITLVDFVRAKDAVTLESSIDLSGVPDDSNAQPWAGETKRVAADGLDGHWSSRWAGGRLGTDWKNGRASLISNALHCHTL